LLEGKNARANKKCKTAAKKTQDGRAKANPKCKTGGQKNARWSDKRGKKCKMVAQKSKKKCKMAKQKKARWSSKKKQDGRANMCKMVEQKNVMAVAIRDSFFFGYQGIFAFQIFYRGKHILRKQKGIPKHHKNILRKIHVESFKQIDNFFDVSFSSTFLVLSRFRVFLTDGSSESPKLFLCDFFLSRFWAFLGEGE
jgi:hypothetical protein